MKDKELLKKLTKIEHALSAIWTDLEILAVAVSDDEDDDIEHRGVDSYTIGEWGEEVNETDNKILDSIDKLNKAIKK